MIIKNDYPILEYSTEKTAIINPERFAKEEPVPRLCLVTFFGEVLKEAVEKYKGTVIGTYVSEMRDFPLYRLEVDGMEVCAIQAVVASGSIAMLTDWLYGGGVEVIVCCGACGVLDDIPAGDVIIPVRALRDEGASYHYLPPARFVELPERPVECFRHVLDGHRIPYIECATWSTDGFCRETREMADHRKQEGCKVVEMECAAMAAVAQFRGKMFGQLLYSGDILTGNADEYDERDWNHNVTARERLFDLALEALCML
ncbi:MAG: nucleoside phosphorylase [Lachnospiraceae bacterium]|nr:nucleoside phosphorylase [Lachnospiraceae bacterium]MCM1240098.1 nucleoside phosphorylase [Lachnospiraceae bacterium]